MSLRNTLVGLEAKAVSFDISQRALILLKGPESLDFLHRISTNDLASLAVGATTQTALITEKGRIFDVLSVARILKDELLLAASSDDEHRLATWLQKFIIMEDIEVEKVKSLYNQNLIKPFDENTENEIIRSEPIVITEGYQSSKWYRLITRKSGQTNSIPAIYKKGSGEQLDVARIKDGIPAFPQELNEEHNPLEANLKHMISFKKGCYVGQEVISRLDTYQKIQFMLARVSLSALPESLPATIRSEGVQTGVLTSAINSMSDNSIIGLAYIQTKFLQAEQAIGRIGDSIEVKVRG